MLVWQWPRHLVISKLIIKGFASYGSSRRSNSKETLEYDNTEKPMNTYVVNFDEGTMRVQAKNEAEALSILTEWFECSPTLLQLI